MKKGIALGLFGIVALCTAATIQWYSQQTPSATLSDTWGIAVERTAPKAYVYSTIGTLKSHIGANYIQNLNGLGTNTTFYDGLTVQGDGVADASFKLWNAAGTFGVTIGIDPGLAADSTVLFPSSIVNAITNNDTRNIALLGSNYLARAVTTNLTVTGTGTNLFGYSDFTNVANEAILIKRGGIIVGTTNVNTTYLTNTYLYSTNAYITILYVTTNYSDYDYITNLIVKNLRADIAYVSNTYATNITIVQGFNQSTNAWDGPTNNLPMNKMEQYYLTYTPCSITNLSSLPPSTESANVILTITNAASTNITLYLPHAGIIPERTASVTISNASEGVISVRYRPQSKTNAVFRLF